MEYSSPDSRELTYLNTDDELPFENEILDLTAEVSWLGILSFLFFFMGVMNIRVSRASQAFYEWNAIRLILPGIQWVMAMDCATVAIDRSMTSRSGGVGSGVANQWAIAIYMLDATVAPGIFLSTFVITFLAYRNRSIPFCMVQRAPGRNDTHMTGNTLPQNSDDLEGVGEGGVGETAWQPLIRPATMVSIIRLFSLFCFFMSLVVNFDVVWNEPNLAGRTGWVTIFTEDWNWDGTNEHIFLGLLPMALVGLACTYFSFLLWRYGTSFSMKIYPNMCNPYFSTCMGTFCLLAGQFFGPNLFPVMSRTGIWLYQLFFLRVMYEVRYDIKQAGDLGHFLDALEDDAVTGSATDMGRTASDKSRRVPSMLPSLQ